MSLADMSDQAIETLILRASRASVKNGYATAIKDMVEKLQSLILGAQLEGDAETEASFKAVASMLTDLINEFDQRVADIPPPFEVESADA